MAPTQPVLDGKTQNLTKRPSMGLSRQIHKRIVKSAINNKPFVPRQSLEEVMSRENIGSELDKNNILTEHLLEYILDCGRKTFATLVRIQRVGAAEFLPKFGFTDTHLPIECDDSHDELVITTLDPQHQDPKALAWFLQDVWGDDQHIINFRNEQWLFLAPVFSAEQVEHELHPDCPIPFTTKSQRVGGGTFSNLFHGCIHPQHHHQDLLPHVSIDGSDGPQVAIKELLDPQINAENVFSPDPDKAYRVEVDVLAMVGKLKHPHLIKFVCAYTQAKKKYLLFQWANGGNLREFWCNYKQPTSTADIIRWALEQMSGMAGAINVLHNSSANGDINCRHGDLKQENIVRHVKSNGLGTLQIADMGLAKVHNMPTQIRQFATSTVSGTNRYQPPETRLYQLQPRSRAYDMWSMGCIYLEFIIWIFYGAEDLIRFNLSFHESFYTVHEEHGTRVSRLDNEVRKWVNYIKERSLHREDGKCLSNALRDLLHFVCDRLLIQEPGPETQAPSSETISGPPSTPVVVVNSVDNWPPNERPTRAKALELDELLKNIVAKARNSTTYLINPNAAIETAGYYEIPKEAAQPEKTSFLRTPLPRRGSTSNVPLASQLANTKVP